MQPPQKKKIITLPWQGGILDNSAQKPVAIKGKELDKSDDTPTNTNKISGKVSLRVEKKGRGGKPVVILFNFLDKEAKNEKSLKQLCSDLKNKLACGGTVEDSEIILMIRDLERLKKILFTDFNLKA